jgi:M6 family metalloprotease-like protein
MIMSYLQRFAVAMSLTFVSLQVFVAQPDIFKCGTKQSFILSKGLAKTNGVQHLTSTYTLKILLVEFADVKHRQPGYTITDFNNLFFSNGIYVSPNMYSPDGQQVYGSMRDYYSVMSNGNFTLTGNVINHDDDHNNVPDWLVLPLRKGQYDSVGFAQWNSFLNAVITAANSAGIDISTNSTTKLAIIYAGHTYRGDDNLGTGSGLNPQAGNYGGRDLYINGEKFACCAPYRSERSDAVFMEICFNVHEFAHLLGVPDLYDNGAWDLMNGGVILGPNFRGACPAPFNPQARYLLGWATQTPVSSDASQQVNYNMKIPNVYKIANSSDASNYWLIETRRFNATMTLGSTTTSDYNSFLLQWWSGVLNQGLLVWRVSQSYPYGTILHADGKVWPNYPVMSTGDPFPGISNIKVLSPWSDLRTPDDYTRWMPNTKPSTNVGMEITGEGVGYYLINAYAVNPVNASPSNPKGLQAAFSTSNSVLLNWSQNTEPDMAGYDLYRSIYYDGATLSYTKVNSSLLTSPTYTDNPSIPTGIPCR